MTALPYRPCVGLMVLNQAGEIFAGQRLDSPYDAWQMPQGGIDEGETPQDAALRELTEETGIDPDRIELLRESAQWLRYDLPNQLVGQIWKGKFRGQSQRWFALRFLGDDAEIQIETAEPEFRRWAWMSPSVLIDSIVPFKRDTYSAVFEEFRDILGAPG
ncbi:MAG: RNA pyrophosphohydrolase [Pseudomonadota bacterium]